MAAAAAGWIGPDVDDEGGGRDDTPPVGGGGDDDEVFVRDGEDHVGVVPSCCCCWWCSEEERGTAAEVDAAGDIQCGGRYIMARAACDGERENKAITRLAPVVIAPRESPPAGRQPRFFLSQLDKLIPFIRPLFVLFVFQLVRLSVAHFANGPRHNFLGCYTTRAR